MSTVKRAFTLNTLSSGSSFIIQLGSAVAISRLLTPEEIGTYSVALAATALLSAFRDFGAGSYVIQKKDLTPEILRSVVGVVTIMSWSLGGLIFIVSGAIASFYSQEEIENILKLISVNFLFVPFLGIVSSMLLRELRFGHSAAIGVTNSAVAAASSIAFAFLGFGTMALAWGSLAGTAAATLLASALRPPSIPWWPSLTHWREVTSYGSKVVYNNIVMQVGQSAPDLILGRMLGMEPVAILSRAAAIRNLLVSQLFGIISATFTPIFASEIRRGADIKNLFLNRNKVITALYLPVYGVLIILSGPLIVLFFGTQWLAAVPIAQILCAISMTGTPLSLFKQVIHARGDVGLLARMETGILVVRIAATAVASFFGLIYVAWALAIEGIFYISYMAVTARRTLGLSFSEIYLGVFPNFVISVVCAAVSAAVLQFLPDYRESAIDASVALLAAGGAAGTVWIAGLFLTKNSIAEHILLTFQRVLRSRVR